MIHLATWALPVMGVTLIITCSTLFYPMRKAVKRWSPKAGELVICPMCTGFWVGLVASGLGLNLLADVDALHRYLLPFGDACAAAWVNWVSHVVLCALGQGKLLSARPDLRDSGEHPTATKAAA